MTEIIAILFFQSDDIYLLFKAGKELGTPIGNKGYDTANQITEEADSQKN